MAVDHSPQRGREGPPATDAAAHQGDGNRQSTSEASVQPTQNVAAAAAPAPIPRLRILRGLRTRIRNQLNGDAERISTFSLKGPTERAQLAMLVEKMRLLQARLNTLDAQIISHEELAAEEEETELDGIAEWVSRAEAHIQLGVSRLGLPALAAAAGDGTSVLAPTPAMPGQPPTALSSAGGAHSEPEQTTAFSSVNNTGPSPMRQHLAASPVDGARPASAAPPVASVDITVEPFGGDSNGSTYKIFRAQFGAWCKRRPDATQVELLLQLVSRLRGAPRTLIASLEMIDENFPVAMQLLEENYAQDEQERRRIMGRLTAVPSVRSSNDVAGLRALLNHVQATTLQLRALGFEQQHYALQLEETVRQALPHQLVFEFDSEARRDRLNHSSGSSASARATSMIDAAMERLQQMIQCLRRYTVHLEEQLMAQPRNKDAPKAPPGRPQNSSYEQPGRWRGDHRPPRRYLQSTAAAATSRPQQKPTHPCFFCNSKEHRPSRCSQPLTVQQRKGILQQKGKCVSCFAKQHSPGRRCEGPKVACLRCNSRDHYTCMHVDNAGVVGNDDQQRPLARQTAALASVVSAAPVSGTTSLVMTATVFVLHAGTEVPVRVFLDPGSMLTFVSPTLIAGLRDVRPSGRVDLRIKGVNSERALAADRYRLCLSGRRKDSAPIVVTAFAYDFDVDPENSCSPGTLRAIRKFGQRFPLADESYYTDEPAPAPVILLGMDYFFEVVGRSMVDVARGLVATKSSFGWLVGGAPRAPAHRVDLGRAHPLCCAAALSQPARDIERLWTTEAIGITDAPADVHTVDECDALQQFDDGLVHDGLSYTVAVPKRSSITTLANNLDQAIRRLDSKRRSLMKDPAAFARYNEEILTFVREGFAERVGDFDSSSAGFLDSTYYMPHQQVITRGESGNDKWRIVFDCSAAAPGTSSLNQNLLPGPSLNPDIVTLLLNFRTQPIAVSADVARAYMMIRIHEGDRPYFRFLWQGPNETTVSCYQFSRVVWGAAPSGFLLAATLRRLFERVDPGDSLRLGDSFYHDDCLRSFANEREAIDFIDRVIEWFDSGGMQLAKWKTNSPAVIDHLKKRGIQSEEACSIEGALLKVLGIAWTPSRDEIKVRLTALGEEGRNIQAATKRTVLRFVASIFDPIGWTSPFTLRGKRLIQQLWSEALKWDDPLPEAALTQFQEWASEVQALCDLRIPRYYNSPGKTAVGYHLHIFGDASESAYAAVAYLQSVFDDGSSQCTFVMAKSRLAPRKPMTLPRLELMAALIATRLRTFLLERLAIKIDSVSHYTDSTTVYHWCTVERPSRWKEFVCNRVAEIQRTSHADEWYHVDGVENVADFATRGVSAEQLKASRDWWQGPQWLTIPNEDRPCRRLRAVDQADSAVVSEQQVTAAPVVAFSPCVDIARFSSLEAAIRVTGRVLTFVRRLRHEEVPQPPTLRAEGEMWLVRWTQAEYLPEELRAARRGASTPSRSPLAPFKLFVDAQGLLRVRSRLVRGRDIPFDEANPIVIPGSSPLARLLVTFHHRVNAHFGANVILSALRRKYWLTRGRQVIKAILHRCVVCRRAHGPAADQVQPPLPQERVSLIVPFHVTGLDYCGPFHVRGNNGTSKSYVALFSCSSIRAVHLELVPSMTTQSTHLALRRFLAAHPGCRQLYTDRARSFERAATEIKRLFNNIKDPETRELLAQRRIGWAFGCPAAPWRNGYIERVVGTVKVALRKTLSKSLVGYEELRTIVSELAAVVNNRPLSYTAGEADAPRPITPADFLHGGPVGPALASLTPLDTLGPNGVLPTTPEELRSVLSQRTNYFKSLSVRWYREYLLQLRSAHTTPSGRAREIQVGDVCLLKDDNQPRLKWNLVRVTEAIAGRDGAVRTYGVRFPNGHLSRRAAQLLCPLEVVQQIPVNCA